MVSEVRDLAKEKPELASELKAAYAAYEKANGVVPVPPGYNPVEQIGRNAQRRLEH